MVGNNLNEGRQRKSYYATSDVDTRILKTTPTHLSLVVLATPSAGSILTIYDNTSAAGDPFAVITSATLSTSLLFNADLKHGLTVTKTGAASFSLIYQ